MRYKLIILLLAIVILSGCVGKNLQTDNKVDNTNNTNNSESKNATVSLGSIVPISIEKYYTTSPPEYLIKMYELSESMYVIRQNVEDNTNRSVLDNSIGQFVKEYNDSSNMVPEWLDYYDLDIAQQLSSENNSAQILADLDSIYSSCTDCHREMKPAVWAKYNWKDFRDIKINTSYGLQNWSVGKIILEEELDEIDINIKNGNKNEIIGNYNLFKNMYNNMVDDCKNCHENTNLKYIDIDVVNNLEKDINTGISSGNFDKVNDTRKQIINDCYNCHIIHETYQRIKEIDEPR